MPGLTTQRIILLGMWAAAVGRRSLRTHAFSPGALYGRSAPTSRFVPNAPARSSFATRLLVSQVDRVNAASTSVNTQSKELKQNQQEQLSNNVESFKVNIHTVDVKELETLMKAWGFPKYRAGQIIKWVRDQGAATFDDMANLPIPLREVLKERATIGSLELDTQLVSKDGTQKRVYRLSDGQLIESVLMPYEDGRNTACISSQAGCAMGCVFCATGQMGFARQLTPDEIFEQVARFASELQRDNRRLSNIVMMGMGEPLANYRNVMQALRRITQELGIGQRKITVSTVGVVPNIRKLMYEEDLQVRLAVSLHCATEEERNALLPANRRYGGLDTLMTTIEEYIEVTGRRVTLEWALIDGQNDTPEVARSLGQLLRRFKIRRDMVHVNLIPLNPTGGFVDGRPSARNRVNIFVQVLADEFGISATPRVRRGIDINAGCGQLKAEVQKKEKSAAAAADIDNIDESTDTEPLVRDLASFMDDQSNTLTADAMMQNPMVGVYTDEDENDEFPIQVVDTPTSSLLPSHSLGDNRLVEFLIDPEMVDMDDEDFEDPEYQTEEELLEAERLIAMVQSSFPAPPSDVPIPVQTTSITDDEAMQNARRRRKKLLKNIKQIGKLRDLEVLGKTLNEEQLAKVQREEEWKSELESVEHNLK